MGNTKKNEPDLEWWTPQAAQAKPHGGQDIENSLSEPRMEMWPRPQKGSNKQFTIKKISNSGSCPPAYRGGGYRQKLPLVGGIDFPSSI